MSVVHSLSFLKALLLIAARCYWTAVARLMDDPNRRPAGNEGGGHHGWVIEGCVSKGHCAVRQSEPRPPTERQRQASHTALIRRLGGAPFSGGERCLVMPWAERVSGAGWTNGQTGGKQPGSYRSSSPGKLSRSLPRRAVAPWTSSSNQRWHQRHGCSADYRTRHSMCPCCWAHRR